MTDHSLSEQETLFLLSDARQNIGQMVSLIRKIARYDPGIARVAVPRVKQLAARQLRLERKAQIQQPLEMGFIMPIVIGGMALLGLGGWVFKHYKETSLERYKLESINKCIEENVKTGMDRGQASEICRKLFTGKDLSEVFSEISKTIMIAATAITGVYIVLRWRK